MRQILIFTCGLFCATPVLAQEVDRIDTPSGPAIVSREDYDTVVSVGDQTFRFADMPYSGFAEQVGNLVLVQISSGGTACPSTFAWLDTTPGAVRMTDEFGTCSDLHEVTSDSETVTVSMPSLMPGEGQVDFVWDGKTTTVQEVVRGAQPSGVPPGGDLDGWIGRFGVELLESSDWQPLLLSLMDDTALLDAQRIVVIGNPFEVQGDWLVSAGCQPHQCDVTAGAVAVHRKDGRLVVALWETGVGPRLFGDGSRGLPSGVAEVMAMQ